MNMALISAPDEMTAKTTVKPTAKPRLVSIVANIAAAAVAIACVMGICPDAAQAQIPTINIQATCQAASAVTLSLLGNTNSRNDLEICMNSENTARQQLVKDWSSFDPADQRECIQTKVYLPSYIEWLTCFEMNKAVRQGKAAGQSMKELTNPDGSMTMPKLSSVGIRSRYLGP